MTPVFRWFITGLAAAALSLAIVNEASAEWYVEIGAGKNTNLTGDAIPWEDGGSPGFYGSIRYEHRVAPGVWAFGQIMHVSNWFAGAPFNDIPESSVDHLGVGLRWRF